MTLGFVVGKFYPPHRGHAHLIRTALGQVDRLVVLLPHHPTQTISGELRKAWLEEVHSDCEIHLVPDEHEDDPVAWAKFTIAHLGRAPDVVFSSEDYGPGFAALLGSRHVMVDRPRATVPVSGRAIRAAPLEHLDFLEPCVRAFFVKRVVLIGAESTGKTTLAAALAKRYETNWVPEYGREHWEAKVAGLSVEAMVNAPPAWTDKEFVTIATGQQRRENEAARSANRVLFCDTNAFATGTWHERYRGRRDARVDAIGSRDRVDLYLLTSPDIPFVQDGVRDGEAIRDWMDHRFAEQLATLPVPTVRLSGSHEARLATATQAIDQLLTSPATPPGTPPA